jgi:hypothetical protein
VLDTPLPAGRQYLAWATVRAALALYGTGMIVILLSLLIEAGLQSGNDSPRRHLLLGLLAFWGQMGAVVLIVAGMAMASAAPERQGKGWAMGSVGCLVVCFLAFLLRFTSEGKTDSGQGWVYLAVFGFLVGKILFTCFLWQVATHFRERALASNVLVYLAVDLGTAVFAFLLNMRESRAFNEDLALNPFLGGKLWRWVFAGMAMWSVILVFMVRERVTRALLGPGYGADDRPPGGPPVATERGTDGNLPGPNPPPQ